MTQCLSWSALKEDEIFRDDSQAQIELFVPGNSKGRFGP